MGLYAQLNSADDRVADTAPAGHPAALDEELPISSESRLHHRATKSQHSNKFSTDGEGSDDEGEWGFEEDEEEGIELMPTSNSTRTLHSEAEGEGRHVDEDEDVHSPAAMVRRVSSSSIWHFVTTSGALVRLVVITMGLGGRLRRRRLSPTARQRADPPSCPRSQVVPEHDDPTMPAVSWTSISGGFSAPAG